MSNSQNNQKYPYGYGLSKISLFKLYLRKANLMKWSFILSLSGFLILYIWSLLRDYVFTGEVYAFLGGYVVTLAFFIWGCLGLFWAYRRQVPQIVTVKGKPALMIGIFMMIVSWLLAIYSLIIGTRDLIESVMK